MMMMMMNMYHHGTDSRQNPSLLESYSDLRRAFKLGVLYGFNCQAPIVYNS
jgi:hypothetical protein